MNSSEAAEAIVKMSLEGVEVAAKITGVGAKNIAALLYAMAKDKKLTKGKTNLNNMLKSGNPLQIFTLKENELKKFHEEAKRYGVLYTVLSDKKQKNKDGMVDIMVRAEDAPKINRIIERFKLSAVDIASIKSEIQKDKANSQIKKSKEKDVLKKSKNEKVDEEVIAKTIKKEELETSNLDVAKTEKSPLSKPSSENKKNLGVASKKKKSSIRELIKEIKNELKFRYADKSIQEELKKGTEVKVVDFEKQKVTTYSPRKKDLKNKGKAR